MQRLKTRAQFQAVMAGSTVSRTAHFALHRVDYARIQAPPAAEGHSPAPPTGPRTAGPSALFAVRDEPAIGCLVPKRWAKRAVTRNAIKRQIYVVSSEFEPQLRNAAHVVRLRSPFDKALFPHATSDALKRAVREELQQLFTGVRE